MYLSAAAQVHFGISKMAKDSAVNYFFSNTFTTGWEQGEIKAFVKLQAWTLRGCNLPLSSIKENIEWSVTHIDFPMTCGMRMAQEIYKR